MRSGCLFDVTNTSKRSHKRLDKNPSGKNCFYFLCGRVRCHICQITKNWPLTAKSKSRYCAVFASNCHKYTDQGGNERQPMFRFEYIIRSR